MTQEIKSNVVSINRAKPDNTHLVAVYGTLKKGFRLNPNIERGGGEFIKEDTIHGILLHLGYFPGFIVTSAGRGRDIPCEVYSVNTATLNILDDIEGVPTLYDRVKVTTGSGTEVWTYAIPSSKYLRKGCQLIPSGGWKGIDETPYTLLSVDPAAHDDGSDKKEGEEPKTVIIPKGIPTPPTKDVTPNLPAIPDKIGNGIPNPYAPKGQAGVSEEGYKRPIFPKLEAI